MAEIHYNDYNINKNMLTSHLVSNQSIPSEDYYCEVPGVYYHFSKAEWRLVYREPQCRHRRLQKTFSTKKYGFYGAREKAIAFKNFIDIQTLSEQSVQPAIRSYVRKKGTERKMRLRKASLCLAVINKNEKKISIPIASPINEPSCFSLVDQSSPNVETLRINNPIYNNQIHRSYNPNIERIQLPSVSHIEKLEPSIMKKELSSPMNFISHVGPLRYFENHYQNYLNQVSCNPMNPNDYDNNYLRPHQIRNNEGHFAQPKLDLSFHQFSYQRFPFYFSQFDDRIVNERSANLNFYDETKNIYIPDINIYTNDNLMGENKEILRYFTYYNQSPAVNSFLA